MLMMKTINYYDFKNIYRSAVRDVLAFWTSRMQEEIAVHCYPWSIGRFDFEAYLHASSIRFYRAYCSISNLGCVRSVCDVGGFWGVLPLTLSSLGYCVTMTEALKYYGESFETLFQFLSEKGVNVINYDPFERKTIPPGQYDCVYVMAIMEHYPHSLKYFIKNVLNMVDKNGYLYIEVPNIAYWPKRMALLKGKTPLVSAIDIYKSEIPFTGHHHEFCKHEIRDLVSHIGLKILQEDFYNYSFCGKYFQHLCRYPIRTIAQLFLPDTKECISYLLSR